MLRSEFRIIDKKFQNIDTKFQHLESKIDGLLAEMKEFRTDTNQHLLKLEIDKAVREEIEIREQMRKNSNKL